MTQIIAANFSHGNAPYLRTVELALAINDRLEAQGKPRLAVVVPWIYGEQQKRIMREEFEQKTASRPQELLLDKRLGEILYRVLYRNSYEDFLSLWIKEGAAVEQAAREHLTRPLKLTTLGGEPIWIENYAIVLELARNAITALSDAPCISHTFGHPSEILEEILRFPERAAALDARMAKKALPGLRRLEERCKVHFMSEPGTFTFRKNRKKRYPNEINSPPPLRPAPGREGKKPAEKGIYVTVSGIPGLGRLYENVTRFGLKIYSNETSSPRGAYAPPSVIYHPNILFHFARAGWGALHLALASGKPCVLAPFDLQDDPEIYFNNLCAESLGLGVVYREQPLPALLDSVESLKKRIKDLQNGLLKKFGTLDGNAFCSEKIVKEYL